MVGGLVVYGVASVVGALAPSMPVLLACRVFQGLSAGAGVIISRTLVRDLYEGADAQRLMSRVMMIFGLAPAIAPVIGGLLLGLGPWPLIFWFLAGLAVVLIVATLVVLPETHPPADRTPLRIGALLRDLVEVARTPRFERVAWAGAFSFGAYFIYIGAAAIVVVDLLHRGQGDFWMLFVPLIAGMVAGSWLSGRSAGRISKSRLVSIGLVIAVGAAAVNIALAAIPATARLPYAVIGPSLLGLAVGMCYPTVQLVVLDQFEHRRGSAASGFTFAGLILNGVGAGVLAPVITGSLRTLALVTMGFVLVAVALWTWHLRVDHDGGGDGAP